MTLAIGADPGQWNCDTAQANRASCLAVVDRVWPSVFHLGADGSPALDQSIATSATQTSASPQTVVYRINPKATWSDGTPITYRDFVYNWQAQSGNPAFRDVAGAPFSPDTVAGYADIADVASAPGDPKTAVVTFARPDPDWRSLFGAGHPLVPGQVGARVGYDRGFTDPVADLASAGPFEIQRYEPGSAITLVRNPRYWGLPANLASVTFRFVTDSAQLAPALRSGALDGVLLPAGGDLPAAISGTDGIHVDRRASDRYERLILNQANPLLADPALRHAIALAVPRDSILKRVEGSIDPSLPLLDDRCFAPGSAGYQDDTGGAYDSANPDQAKAVLSQAGYALAGGILTKAGRPVTLRLTSTVGDADRQATEQLIVAALARLGIAVTEADVPDVDLAVGQGSYDLAIDSATVSPFPSRIDDTYRTGGPTNASRVSDPHVDDLIAQAETTFDAQRRVELYNQIDTQLWADNADLPLFQLPATVVSRTTYLNATASATGEGPTFDLDQWGVKASS